MAEWLKASRLKGDSGTRGFGDPAQAGEAEGAERLSTSYSLRRRRKEVWDE